MESCDPPCGVMWSTLWSHVIHLVESWSILWSCVIHLVESCDTTPHLFCLSSDQTSSSNMKIDALNFLTVMLTHHSPHVLNPHIGTIIPVSHLFLSIHPSRSLCYSIHPPLSSLSPFSLPPLSLLPPLLSPLLSPSLPGCGDCSRWQFLQDHFWGTSCAAPYCKDNTLSR